MFRWPWPLPCGPRDSVEGASRQPGLRGTEKPGRIQDMPAREKHKVSGQPKSTDLGPGREGSRCPMVWPHFPLTEEERGGGWIGGLPPPSPPDFGSERGSGVEYRPCFIAVWSHPYSKGHSLTFQTQQKKISSRNSW